MISGSEEIIRPEEASPMQQHLSGFRRKFSHSIAFSSKRHYHSSKASRGEDLQIEHPIACRYTLAFHFHPALTSMLGPTLIRNQVVPESTGFSGRPMGLRW
jgi:hypothetical protein